MGVDFSLICREYQLVTTECHNSSWPSAGSTLVKFILKGKAFTFGWLGKCNKDYGGKTIRILAFTPRNTLNPMA
jgi:hypothetical protein